MPPSVVWDDPLACLHDGVTIASFVSKGKNSFLKNIHHMFKPCVIKCNRGPYF